MKLRKAIVPAAGYGTRMLPASRAIRKEFFPIVDTDGLVKPAIQLIVEEAVASGIAEICLVVAPGGEEAFRSYFSPAPEALRLALRNKPAQIDGLDRLAELGQRLTFVTQTVQEGYGDAIRLAGPWANGEPVLTLLGDHVYLSQASRRCARQLIDAFERLDGPVSGVIRKPPSDLKLFGTLQGEQTGDDSRLYRVREIVEKPETDYARTHLQLAELPVDTFLCFFGLHALNPDIFDTLDEMKARGLKEGGELQLTGAQALLASRRPYYALEIEGEPYDIGVPEGYARTVAAFGTMRGRAKS